MLWPFSSSEEHESCRRWLTDAAAAGDAIGLCELVEAALLRIPTLPRLALVPMADTLGFWKDDLSGVDQRDQKRLCGELRNSLGGHFPGRCGVGGAPK